MTANQVPVWWDEPADAVTNMAADELLASEADRRGCLVVRLYGWTPAAVSLGAFQEIAAARRLPDIAGLPLVRRPSGGGAIIHGSDLTYAAAVPRRHPLGGSPQALYDAFHAAMVDELRGRGIAARLHRAAAAGDDRADRLLCFDRRAEGDVVASLPGRAPAADDPKIMGSAQRRLAAVVLQHGSLLMRANAAVGPAARHPGILDIDADACPAIRGLVGSWLERVSRGCGAGIDWQADGFLVGRQADLDAAAARFQDARWTSRR